MNEGSPSNLLSALWRSENVTYFIGYLDGGKFVQTTVSTPQEGIALGHKQSHQGRNAFFACSPFKSSQSRQASNAKEVFGFWMDIDCGPDKASRGIGYPNKKAALDAINEFCAKTGIPSPTYIVDSGGGLHLYWILKDPLNPIEFKYHARNFKEVAAKLGFLADPHRTADVASVLRIPGTYNFKYEPPRLVEILNSGGAIETEEMLHAIDNAYSNITPNIPDHIQAFIKDNPIKDDLPETDINIEKVKGALGFINPYCGYDQWFRILCSIKSLGWKCSRQIAHEWSRGDYLVK